MMVVIDDGNRCRNDGDDDGGGDVSDDQASNFPEINRRQWR